MSALKRVIAVLSVSDLERTRAFYVGKLGFELIASFGEPEPVWCHLRHGPVHLMFNMPRDPDFEALPGRVRDFQIFYFYPEDVMAFRETLLARGLAVSGLRDTIYGMREFELRDPDGYWLWFGQPLDTQVITSDPRDAEGMDANAETR